MSNVERSLVIIAVAMLSVVGATLVVPTTATLQMVTGLSTSP